MDDLIYGLSYLVFKALNTDDAYMEFGFSKKPKHGSVILSIAPKKYALEVYLNEEFVLLSLIDVLNGIKLSDLSKSKKLLVGVNLLESVHNISKNIFDFDKLLNNLVERYDDYRKITKDEKLCDSLIERAMHKLPDEVLVKYMVGVAELFLAGSQDYYFYEANKISSFINETKIIEEFDAELESEFRKKLASKIKNILG